MSSWENYYGSSQNANTQNPLTSQDPQENSFEGMKDVRRQKSPDGKDLSHVIGGLKACINNSRTTIEAKESARRELKERFGIILDDKSKEHEKDPAYVAAGLRGTLNNRNVSAEAKASARERLESGDF